MSDSEDPLDAVVGSLSHKQRETLLLLAEGLTSKEIAARLEVSHSAAVQRVETLRRKFGGITKNEVGRRYREYLARTGDRTCIEFTGQKNQLPDALRSRQYVPRNQSASDLMIADSCDFQANPPRYTGDDIRLVPEVLDGENAVPARWAFVVMAAVGMAVLLLVLLAVARAIGDLA